MTSSLPAMAQELIISVSNLTHGIYLTLLLASSHGGSTFAFHFGTKALVELRLKQK